MFLIGIYHGFEKPSNSNKFLQDFISEVLDFTKNDIIINNIVIKVVIQVICCDVPTKSFILRVKGHSGFSSCTRCIQEGIYLKNRVCFPYIDNGCIRRIHNNYISMKYEDHHVSPIISCISLIPDINIVSLFCMDYMHLVCLDIMKKLLHL